MNKWIIALINKYQKASANTAPKCRFVPSCSSYAKECYMRFGFFYATFLTLIRIIRCNPLSKARYYPAPPLPLKKKIQIRPIDSLNGIAGEYLEISYQPSKKITPDEVIYYLERKYFPHEKKAHKEPLITNTSLIYYELI